MASQPSQQTPKYKSLYTDKEISATQYIAELLCKNKATQFNMELPHKFWGSPLWYKFYLLQIQSAGACLKIYPEQFLIRFVLDNNIWSLSPNWVSKKMGDDYKLYNKQDFKVIEGVENASFKNKKDIDIDYLD
jgi:hypothetical protein